VNTINNPPSPIDKIAQINKLLQLDNLKAVKELLVLLLRYFPLDIVAGANVTIEKDTKFSVYKITASGSGTTLLLQTDGVNNPTQNILNLVEGTNMTITDDGAGNITFDASGGGGGTYTVDNGLTENPANNFQLGGTLIQNTTIDIDTHILNLVGTSNLLLYVDNTGGGAAGYFKSANEVALYAQSLGEIAFEAISESSEAAIRGIVRVNGNNIEKVLIAGRLITSGTVGIGVGASIETYLPFSSSPIADRGSSLKTYWSSVAPLFNATWELHTVTNNVVTLKLSMLATGQMKLDKYGIGTFVASPTYILGVDASGNVVETTASGTGTVTSVDLTMPAAFSVTGNPITTSGTLAVAAAGLSTQYIRGDGQLANFPTTSGGGASVSYYLNGSVSQGTFGGVAFREMSRTPIFGAGTNFSINADGYIQSFITDANDPNQLLIPAGNWIFEMYFNASSGGGSPSFYVELYKWDGTTLTLIATSSANPEGITNGTTVDLYTTALAVPSTVLAATDRLAVRVYVTHSGRTITLHTEDNNLCEIITTFSTGLTALNGLTDQVQFLAVGTSGTDFAINSTGSTHTFNIPSASALNRGLLLAADWTTFNGKLSSTLADTNIFVGNASNIATAVAMSGDTTIANTGAVTLKNNLRTGSFGVTIDGVTSVIQVGQVGYVVIPYAGTITGWSITANVAGNVQFDIWKATSAIPLSANSIIGGGGNYPALSASQFITSTTMTSWTTTFAAGDVFGFYINSASTIKNATLTLRCNKT